MNLSKIELLLLTILFLGLLIRVYHLGSESIWFDEAVSIKDAHSNLVQIINTISTGDHNPPLHFIMLHYWINLFGDSEFSSRFLSVIFGFFSIFMIYKVGTLIFDKEVGILSALLLALSSFHIFHSQEARMYSLMTLLTLLSIYFFIRLLSEKSLMVSFGYIISSILLIYAHNFGLFIILAENIYIVTLFLLSNEAYKLKFRSWIVLQAILLALYTPWVSSLIKQIIQVESISDNPVPSIFQIIKTVSVFSNANILLCLLFITLLCFSVLTYEKSKGHLYWRDLFKSIESYQFDIRFSNTDKVYLLLLWLLTPIIVPFIISKFSTPIYEYRYTIGASLAFYLLVAAGTRNLGHKYIKLAIISVIIVLSLTQVRRYFASFYKEQWRDIASYIDTSAKQRDLLIFNQSQYQIPFDYYSKRTDLIKKRFPTKALNVDEENIKELGLTVEGNHRVWVILCHNGDNKGLIKKELSESYNLSYHNDYAIMSLATGTLYKIIEVYLFEKK